jgi:TonB family protein
MPGTGILSVTASFRQLRESGMVVSFSGADMQAPSLNRHLVVLCIAGLLGSATMLAQAQKITPPKSLHVVAAEYPRSAIDEGIEGTVWVTLTIPPSGVPKDVKIAQGLRPDFDKSAIESARQSRFWPAKRDGKPIEVTITMQVDFKKPVP